MCDGGMCGRGMHGWEHVWHGGHVWGACMAGECVGRLGMCGGGHAWQRGMHGRWACMAEGHAWWGVCVTGGTYIPQQILRDTVNERAVGILLECILVLPNAGRLVLFLDLVGKESSLFG